MKKSWTMEISGVGPVLFERSSRARLKLLRLPAELMDYVILHELAHTRIKNHGPRFWAELEGLAPEARRLRAELNHYPLILL